MLLLIVVWSNVLCCVGRHMPTSNRNYSDVNPFEAANILRECVSEFKLVGTGDVGVEQINSTWAGMVLHGPRDPVIVGPLVPKDASSLMRVLFGDKNRPDALKHLDAAINMQKQHEDAGSTSTESTSNPFWFAIVRDPMSQFVDSYMQASNGVAATAECPFARIRTPECVDCMQLFTSASIDKFLARTSSVSVSVSI